jgi:glycerophosphoryl diester phosphodiesterase
LSTPDRNQLNGFDGNLTGQRPYDFAMTVAVSAHKGGSEDAPPATWEAYETALTTGAEYVEFDIRRTRDGDLVVLHDERVANRAVAEVSYDELCGFVATTSIDASIYRIKESFPEVTTALSVGRDLRQVARVMRLPARARELYPISRMRACGADWLAVHRRLARANVLRLCGRFGVPAMVWTVNGEPQMRHFLADPRVTVLITDRPRHALRLRAE